MKALAFIATLLSGCGRPSAELDRPTRADSQSLLGQHTDSAITRLVHDGWKLYDFASPHMQALKTDAAALVLYSQAGRVCYVQLASAPSRGYDPERPDSMLVYMSEDHIKAAYTTWLGYLIGPHGLPVASSADSASWGALHIKHGTQSLHGFVGYAAGCLEPADHDPEDILDR
jgi:hypothetical protein